MKPSSGQGRLFTVSRGRGTISLEWKQGEDHNTSVTTGPQAARQHHVIKQQGRSGLPWGGEHQDQAAEPCSP